MRKMLNARDAYGKTLLEIGKQNPKIVALDADLSDSTKTCLFGKEFPERFFDMGIAEQNMMGTAAGLATTGKIVFASTFAMFATGRVYDQIRQSIVYPRQNVKIVATHAGITVGGDGASHQITEDIGLMRVLPGMTIIVPADAIETEKVIRKIANHVGPAYIRIGRANVPVIYDDSHEFEIGKATVHKNGNDATIIAIGIMVSIALDAAEILEKEGIYARVINMSTVKPIDKEIIIKSAKETGAIVTAEEHSTINGLGSAVAEVLVENFAVPMKRVGIPDVFGESGDVWELMNKYGLTKENIVKAVHEVIKRKEAKE